MDTLIQLNLFNFVEDVSIVQHMKLYISAVQVRHSDPVQRPLGTGEPPRQRSVSPPTGRRRDEHPLQPVQR